MSRPKKIDPIVAALLDAEEDAEAGVDNGGAHGGGDTTELRDHRRRKNEKLTMKAIPSFDHPDRTTRNHR